MKKIKICGVTSVADARFCANAGVDYIGLNFSQSSPRQIGINVARDIVEAISDSDCLPVGVFVEHDLTQIKAILDQTGITIAQFHGDQSREASPYLAADIAKIHVVHVDANGEMQNELQAISFQSDDFILFDNLKGGSGVVFDHGKITRDSLNLTNQARETIRLAIAGGINPENIAEYLSADRFALIDLCSGVEQSPGIKDYLKIDKLLNVARGHYAS